MDSGMNFAEVAADKARRQLSKVDRLHEVLIAALARIKELETRSATLETRICELEGRPK